MTRRTTPDNCVGCNRPMRTKTGAITPGTVTHGGRGHCSVCYYRITRGLPLTDTPDHTGLTTNEQRTRDALHALANDRRRRGIPTQGILMAGEKPDKVTEIPL